MRKAEVLALLLQRMPRKPILRGQEAILRLRRRGRPLHKESARPKGVQRHLRRGDREDGLHRLGRGPERAIPPPHIRVRRLAEGHLLRTHRQEARLRRLPKRQGPSASEIRQVQPQIRLFREKTRQRGEDARKDLLRLQKVRGIPSGSQQWQCDSVEGKATDRKAILTITYPEFRFQFGFLIAKGNARSALGKLALLRKLLGADYAGIFQCNLSDNGPEFARFHEIEEWGVRAFFANPYRSTDKAACERNHEFIRYVIPKGRSLDGLTQAKVELLFSHINSYVRGSNENRTPYELMLARFGEGFMEAIGIRRIQAKEVCLKPSLLK